MMKQCWAEAPDARPDFDVIAHRFKDFNKGRYVVRSVRTRNNTIALNEFILYSFQIS